MNVRFGTTLCQKATGDLHSSRVLATLAVKGLSLAKTFIMVYGLSRI
jgi:hypothetical protein